MSLPFDPVRKLGRLVIEIEPTNSAVAAMKTVGKTLRATLGAKASRRAVFLIELGENRVVYDVRPAATVTTGARGA